MKLSERMKEMVEQGLAVSKGFAVRTGGKAQELGERGVLMVEVKQLETQAQKLINRLGNEAYRAFIEDEQKTLSSEEHPFKGILTEITLIQESIEKKEQEMQTKKK